MASLRRLFVASSSASGGSFSGIGMPSNRCLERGKVVRQCRTENRVHARFILCGVRGRATISKRKIDPSGCR